MSVANSVVTERKLVGYDNFKRFNPNSDKFEMLCFHHVEFYCSDSTNVSRRFSYALGMPIVAISNSSTGNSLYCSTVIKSNDLCFVFTAPYGISFTKKKQDESTSPHPEYSAEAAHTFIYGTAVCRNRFHSDIPLLIGYLIFFRMNASIRSWTCCARDSDSRHECD